MWWRLIVLVLSIVISIIILLQQFDDVNATSTRQFSSDLREFFSEHFDGLSCLVSKVPQVIKSH